MFLIKNIDKLYKYFNYIKLLGVILSGIAIIGMIIFITADVFSRNILSSSLPGSYEFVENYFMPLATIPAIVYAYTEGLMPRMNMIVVKFPKTIQKGILYIILCFDFFIVALLTYYAFTFSISSMLDGASFPAGNDLYPIYHFMFIAPIGFSLVLIEIIFILLKNLFSKENYITYKEKELSNINESINLK